MNNRYKLVALTLMTLLLSPVSGMSEDYPEVKSIQLADGLYMLSAKGGNIGLLIGQDGTFVIDDQFAVGSEAILNKINQLGGEQPKFLINTHFHGDHTGGNEAMGKIGAVIVSHDNVRKRLTVENLIKAFDFRMPPMAKDGLPVVTFSTDLTFHLNGGEVHAFHVPGAHTDGDAVIHFKSANVIHTGDIFFNGFYPFIDPHHGGSLQGMIDGADIILALSNAQTKIIPGHGPLATRTDLQTYRKMLSTANQRLKALKKQGKSVQQAIQADPLKDLSEKWGKTMFSSEKWISIIYPTVQ